MWCIENDRFLQAGCRLLECDPMKMSLFLIALLVSSLGILRAADSATPAASRPDPLAPLRIFVGHDSGELAHARTVHVRAPDHELGNSRRSQRSGRPRRMSVTANVSAPRGPAPRPAGSRSRRRPRRAPWRQSCRGSGRRSADDRRAGCRKPERKPGRKRERRRRTWRGGRPKRDGRRVDQQRNEPGERGASRSVSTPMTA